MLINAIEKPVFSYNFFQLDIWKSDHLALEPSLYSSLYVRYVLLIFTARIETHGIQYPEKGKTYV